MNYVETKQTSCRARSWYFAEKSFRLSVQPQEIPHRHAQNKPKPNPMKNKNHWTVKTLYVWCGFPKNELG